MQYQIALIKLNSKCFSILETEDIKQFILPGRASTSTGSDISDDLPTPASFTARTLKT